jgi:hypothetical protein
MYEVKGIVTLPAITVNRKKRPAIAFFDTQSFAMRENPQILRYATRTDRWSRNCDHGNHQSDQPLRCRLVHNETQMSALFCC